jgi:hypothetical protein
MIHLSRLAFCPGQGDGADGIRRRQDMVTRTRAIFLNFKPVAGV